MAVIRYLLLPLYAKWWVAQTSSRIFAFLLLLYVVQMMNWAIYSYNVNRNNYRTDNNESDVCIDPVVKSTNGSAEFILMTELLMPMALSLMLSVIHSQIVATSSNNLSNSDNHEKGPVHLLRKKRERRKRRKSVISISNIFFSWKETIFLYFDLFNTTAINAVKIIEYVTVNESSCRQQTKIKFVSSK